MRRDTIGEGESSTPNIANYAKQGGVEAALLSLAVLTGACAIEQVKPNNDSNKTETKLQNRYPEISLSVQENPQLFLGRLRLDKGVPVRATPDVGRAPIELKIKTP